MVYFQKIRKALNFIISGTAINVLNIFLGLLLTATLYRYYNIDIIGKYIFVSSFGMLLSQVLSLGNYELVLAKKDEIKNIFHCHITYLQSYFIFYLLLSIGLTLLIVHMLSEWSFINGFLVFLILIQRYLNTLAKNLDWYWVSELVMKIAIPTGMIILITSEFVSDIFVTAFIMQILACLVLSVPILQNIKFNHIKPVSSVRYTIKNFQYLTMSIVDNLNNLLPPIILGLLSMNAHVAIWNLFMQLFRGMTIHNEIVDNYFRFVGKAKLLTQRELFEMVIQNLWLIVPISASALLFIVTFDEVAFDFLRITNIFEGIEMKFIYTIIFLFSCVQSFTIFDIYSSSRTYVVSLSIGRLLSLIIPMGIGLFFDAQVFHIFVAYVTVRLILCGLSIFRSFLYHAI